MIKIILGLSETALRKLPRYTWNLNSLEGEYNEFIELTKHFIAEVTDLNISEEDMERDFRTGEVIIKLSKTEIINLHSISLGQPAMLAMIFRIRSTIIQFQRDKHKDCKHEFLFLIEEPDLFMNPSLQKRYLAYLKKYKGYTQIPGFNLLSQPTHHL